MLDGRRVPDTDVLASGPVFILQVSLLVVMEIGLFPLICGWWLDICSLVSSDYTVGVHHLSRETSGVCSLLLGDV